MERRRTRAPASAGAQTACWLMPVFEAINAARKKDSQFDDSVLKKPDSELRELIVDRIGSSARKRTTLSGFSGESEFDLRRGSK